MPLSRMASGIRSGNKLLGGDEIDAALDGLGSFSYLDGVPFELDRSIKSALEGAQIHLAKADALMAIPIPSSITDTSKDDELLADIGRIEKQVLDQLRQIEKEREDRRSKKEAAIKEYEEKKANELKLMQEKMEEQKAEREKELKLVREQTAAQNDIDNNQVIGSATRNENDQEHKEQNLAEEVKEEISDNHGKEQSPSCMQSSGEITAVTLESSSSHSSNGSSEEQPAVSTLAQSPPPASSTIVTSQAQSPDATSLQTIPTTTGGYLEPSRNNQLSLVASEGKNNLPTTIAPGSIINFSEFERESDPFEKAELQTINDMQALAAVFPQTSNFKHNNAGMPSASASKVNMGQVFNSMQSKNHTTVVTSGNQQSATGQLNQQTRFHYSQQPLPQAMAKVPTTHSSTQYNTYYQQPHTGSMSHQQSLGNYYTPGAYHQSTGVSSGYAPMLGGAGIVANSGQQQYPQGQVYNQHQTIATPYIPPYRPSPPAANDLSSTHRHQEQQDHFAETLKRTKSVGDLMSEIQKETDALILDTSAKGVGNRFVNHQVASSKPRQYSQTPPPETQNINVTERPSIQKDDTGVSKERRSVFDNWIPWPDIDGLPSSSANNQKSTEPLRNVDPKSTLGSQHRSSSTPPSKDTSNRRRESVNNPLDGLSQESSEKCKRIHDMGFPLDRLARACKVLGSDDQKLINYCLLVDKLAEDPTMASAQRSISNYDRIIEEVTLLHSMDEVQSRKHLESFCRLAEFGFEPPSKIHDALIKCDLDYEKALEQMLG